MLYNWQQADWPDFRYDLGRIEGDLLAFADRAGQVGGLLRALPEAARDEAVADVLIAEAIKTSAIESIKMDTHISAFATDSSRISWVSLKLLFVKKIRKNKDTHFPEHGELTCPAGFMGVHRLSVSRFSTDVKQHPCIVGNNRLFFPQKRNVKINANCSG